MFNGDLNHMLEDLEQCIKDAQDIQTALKETPAAEIRRHRYLRPLVKDLYNLVHWLEHIAENEEEED